MAKNTFKEPKGTRKNLFSVMERLVRVDRFFENGLPLKYLPNVLFTILLIIFYIGYNHYADKNARNINKLEAEVEDLRAHYTTLKAQYMYSRLQSEVQKKVKPLGLVESMDPPFKLKMPVE
ncbi:hypothetical protein MNBD_BACTEROID06-222 [hydrothermal vent metagenome]|uniref:Cell division protein FtsL n=1 Tax=hydrothermal vent metagenome TaxID=652676 RepID=A0A3B0UCY5_9ZZZZ